MLSGERRIHICTKTMYQENAEIIEPRIIKHPNVSYPAMESIVIGLMQV